MFGDPAKVSMAELVVPDDILEKIMIGLEVKDLIRCKSVCKSWKSFILSSRFVKAQLTYSYNNDRNNSKFLHRRIVMPYTFVSDLVSRYRGFNNSLVGSSNGLVCISPSLDLVLVANPSTREVGKLQNPVVPECIEWTSLYYGFGYDKSTDDYKVVVGFEVGKDLTRFQVLNLKSNVWKVVGEVNHTSFKRNRRRRRIATMRNGALHWFMKDRNNKGVIVSFDLCKEEFKEIPQPQDARYRYNLNIALGTFEECLCIFQPYRRLDGWVMKKYTMKESWTLLPYVPEKGNDVVHYLDRHEDYNPHMSFFIEDCMFESRSYEEYLNAPIFVQSIVSPHVFRRLKKDLSMIAKMQIIASRMIRKLMIGGFSWIDRLLNFDVVGVKDDSAFSYL